MQLLQRSRLGEMWHRSNRGSEKMEETVRQKNQVDFLNIIRFIAFLMVFCLHAKSFAPAGWQQCDTAWLFYTPAWAGVWIFFILSGYGTGAGFFSGRYPLDNGKDLLLFWWGRFKKLAPMYYFYLCFALLFVSPALLTPKKQELILVLKLLVFWYEPEVDAYGLGIVWYLCTLIKLYFVAPFFWIVIKKLVTSPARARIVVIILTAVGLGARFLGRYVIMETGAGAWHIDIYKPFYFNLDLFLAGFCLNGFKEKKESVGRQLSGQLGRAVLIIERLAGSVAFLVLLFYNNYIYFTANILKKHNMPSEHFFDDYWWIYQYLLPTIYLVVILWLISAWDMKRDCGYAPFSWKACRRNPLRVFDRFPALMMTCYLFHANVLKAVGGVLSVEIVQKGFSNVGASIAANDMPFATHLVQMLLAFILTILFAYLLSGLNAAGSRQRKKETN